MLSLRGVVQYGKKYFVLREREKSSIDLRFGGYCRLKELFLTANQPPSVHSMAKPFAFNMPKGCFFMLKMTEKY